MIKRFLLYFISISALPGFVFWLFYQLDIRSHEHLFKFKETALVNLQSKAIASHFHSIESDLVIISELYEFPKLAESHEDYSSKEIEEGIVSISLRKGIYDQIRFIGKTGQEVLRVNYNNGKPLLVPKDRLQNKTSRYYFKKTMSLDKEKVYVSPLDLNFEKGEVEKPFKPVIRFGVSIFNIQDEKQGILTLNFSAQLIIDSFKNTGLDSLGQKHLLNSNGYWLSSPNPENEWGFTLEERKNKAFSNAFPDEWTTILEEETGQFSTHKGLFTFTTLYPIMETQKMKSVFDNAQGVSVSRAKAYFWKIVSFVPQEALCQALGEEAKNLQNTFLMLYAFLVLLICIGIFLFVKASEQKRKAETGLHQCEHIVSSSTDMMALLDKRFTYIAVNQASLNASGKTSEEIIGHTVPQTFGEEFFETVIKPNALRCLAGEKINYQAWFEFPSAGRKYMDVTYSPYIDVNNNVNGFVVNARDITERKSAEEKIRGLSQAVEQSPATVVITDTKGNIEYVNPKFCEITGYSYEEVIGQNPRILKSGEKPPEGYKELWDTITSGREWRGEFRNKKKNGDLYWEQASISPIKDEEGDITHFLAVKEDISRRKKDEEELKKSEEQLRQAQKMEAVGTLAGGVAHDFNNLLTSIIGYTEMSMGKLNRNSDTYDHLNQALNASFRAKDIVAQLLAYSRKSGDGKMPLQIDKITSDTLKLLGSSLPTSISIQNEIEQGTQMIMGNPTQIQQVLMNLCINAGHAMPDGGTLKVILKDLNLDKFEVLPGHEISGAYILLSIEDNGIGMDKATMERIFDPFFTTKEVGKGTGLGLSAVYGIIKQHYGYITVDSEKGVGTIFNIYLPAIKQGTKTISAKKTVKTGKEPAFFEDKEKGLDRIGAETSKNEIIINIHGKPSLNATGKDKLLEFYVLSKSEQKKIVVNCSSEVQQSLKNDGFDKFLEIKVKE